MKPVTFPDRSCREHVYGDNYQADVCGVVLGHPGPCASLAIPRSVELRDEWEANHPEWEKDIGSYDITL